MQKIIIASGNRGKIAEIKSVLAEQAIELVAKTEFGIEDPDETGLSFVENAILKARHAASLSHLPALADDSGLVVDALQGAPGIYSSRYAGIDASDEENVEKLLYEMKGFTGNERSAYFFCAIAFVLHAEDPCPVIAEARWHGQIASSASGTQGFGYDPVFYLNSHHCTAAELDPKVKNKLSHRAQALHSFGVMVKEYGLF
ncbi:MAG TPA: RdgB/HAM1 family non-canonical purine NTP pyrophosphatase [Pseudomonadales bacterium]